MLSTRLEEPAYSVESKRIGVRRLALDLLFGRQLKIDGSACISCSAVFLLEEGLVCGSFQYYDIND